MSTTESDGARDFEFACAGARKIGVGGDFTTAPEITPLFGHCIARHCAEVLAAVGGGEILELGAGSGRLTRQLILESVVLSAGGAVVGLSLGLVGVRALLALTARELPGAVDASLHLPVVLFTMVLSVLTGILFGIVPAVAVLRGDVAAFLKEDGAKCGTAGRRSTRAHASS